MNRFEPNPRFEAQIRQEAEWTAMLADAARRIADEVRALAPDGTYARHTFVEGGAVHNDDGGAIPIEFGTSKSPPYAPLRRGAEAAGYKVRDHR